MEITCACRIDCSIELQSSLGQNRVKAGWDSILKLKISSLDISSTQIHRIDLLHISRLEPTKQLPSEAHDYSNIPYQKEALVRKTKATNQRNKYLYSSALGVFANYTPLYEHEYCKHFTPSLLPLASLKYHQSQPRHSDQNKPKILFLQSLIYGAMSAPHVTLRDRAVFNAKQQGGRNGRISKRLIA